MPLCEYWLSGPFAGIGFFVPYPLVRPSAGACGRFFPEPVRDGAERGWFRAFVCPVVCRVLTICKHVPTCPDKGTRPAGRRAPEPLLFPRLTPPLFFSRHRRRKRGCGCPLFGLPVRGRGRGRPSRRVFRRPLRRGCRALPGRTSEDMVSYDRRGRAPSLRRRDASGMPNEIVSYLRYAVHHGFSGGRSRFSNASRSPLRQRIFPQ